VGYYARCLMASDSTGDSRALVTADWLAERLQRPDIRVADVRWYLPHLGKSGRAEYMAEHIPGAVFVDLDTELAGPPGSGPGRHPLPGPEPFATAMSRAGVGPTTHVVAYDDSGGAIASRLWWLLHYYGHSRASVLDGGIAAWRAVGHPLTTEVPSYARGDFKAIVVRDRVVDKQRVDALRLDPSAIVLDARATERYEGRVEPVDARPGHIPGAKSAPFAENLAAPEPTFLNSGKLRDRYARLGVTPEKTVVAYCGSGVTACHTLLALHLAGFPHGLLYEGSWSDWSADPSLPAATAGAAAPSGAGK
jgi:thiosulfate/3-mercaptopyruvate sulfurtransferase